MKPQDLKPGMAVNNRQRGKIVIDFSTLQPTGDFEIWYHYDNGYGVMVVLPNTEFEVIE